MYTAPNLSTSPTTDPPQPAPLSSGEVRTILWRARGGFAEAWSWRLEGWTGYRPLLHAVALLLCLASLAGCGAGSAEPSYQIQGAVRMFTSNGPVDVIVVRRAPAVQQ